MDTPSGTWRASVGCFVTTLGALVNVGVSVALAVSVIIVSVRRRDRRSTGGR
ncbi:hypothetical protein Q0F99_09265 [Rathayibacter oskolensis]|uniref:hypothetical protein n=1 Tax=Rathayibacter oskolensis TaxID=1891671 RepID=UPI00265FB0E1|nr:hypothetical protein [Rathayibacter oskolensis]WKK73020.1 hypothetical protein Q0F99_09265 [Rathayibacter oskolensis]